MILPLADPPCMAPSTTAADELSVLKRLVYTSAVVAPLSPSHLSALLSAGRQRNEQAGITGLMSHHGGHFLHCLEGPTLAVATVLGSLLRDRRHRDVVMMASEPITTRAFPTWFMAYAELDAVEWTSLRAARWSADTPPVDGDVKGIGLLQALWSRQRTQPALGTNPGPPSY